ncbi:P-loop NTPase, partial [bacterium]|nr:P-loop NTPase [bacterium]
MKTIVVASGKGGVGKSMIASTLTFFLSRKKKLVAIDADVDAPNLHLWLGGVKKWDTKRKVSLSEKAVVLKENCPECQKWQDICQFGALQVAKGKVTINPFLCEGCGACEAVFPPGVVKLKKVVNGEIRTKRLAGFSLISAQLYPGETGSGKLVDELKKEAEKVKEKELVLIDAPAG